MAPLVGVNPKVLASAGWGVIFSQDQNPQIREMLEPLLRHRQEQAGERFRILEHRPGESKSAFLSRHGAGPGPADPDRVPYYLLIVGDPATIDFNFQSQLDLQYAVGRLWFEDLDSYFHYARNVVEAESGERQKPKSMAVFGVENAGDPATEKLSEELIAPLVKNLSLLDMSWNIEPILGEGATKSRLASLLGGDATPSFLFMGAHGLYLPCDAPQQRQAQGALICSDWQGFRARRGPNPAEFFSAADVDEAADLEGLIVFAFGCFTAGTPLYDNFALSSPPKRLTTNPFVAALPQRLLGKPSGAIAFIGNIDRSWAFSWNMGPEGPQIGTYLSTIAGILDGSPIGHAMEYFNHRYAELAAQMNELLKSRESGARAEEEEIERLWYATADAQNFVILGDPAVALRAVPEIRGAVRLTEVTEGQQAATIPAGTAPPSVGPSAKSLREKIEGPVHLGRISGALNDRVSDQTPDYLGYSPYAKALSDLITSPHTVPPLTIGIFGEWGVGKSFLLKSIKNELEYGTFAEGNQERPASVRIIEFNAWEYSAHDQIWPGLVRKIIDHMEKRLPGGWWRLWRARVQRNFRRQVDKGRGRLLFLLVAIATGLAIVATLSGGEFSLALQVASIVIAGGALKFLGDLISNPLGKWIIDVFQGDEYGKQIGFMEEIAADLRFLGAEIRDPSERIVIIIDDLDRCEPNRSVEMLKAIKLLLDFDRFIVLLGIDARVIGSAVDKHYEDLLGKAGVTGDEYLDKIIQIPFQIPPASDEEVEFFIYQLMERPEKPTTDTSPEQEIGEENLGIAERQEYSTRDPKAKVTEPVKSRGDAINLLESATTGKRPAGPVSRAPVTQAAPLPPASFYAMTESYEAVDLSFSYREMRVFQRLISHVERNPRHIKRTMNVYRLVRAIAFRKQDLITLRHPEETVLWVTLCLQWPQELNLILGNLEILQREPKRVVPTQLSTDPLPVLFDEVRAQLPKSSGARDRCRRLQWLLADPEIPRPDHLAVLRLQRYAIHTRLWQEALPSSESL